jgi:3-hydroxybutyryl-CoA dehydrogenase
MMKQIKNVLICGGGMMGKGIAQIFSQKEELRIIVFDKFPIDIHSGIRTDMEQLKVKGIVSEEKILSCLKKIKFTQDFNDDSVKNADLVIECVFEDMKIKQDLFYDLEQICSKDTIFCTNTSVMSPTEISARVVNKERFVGTHFWNPAFLIPLVEVVKTDSTSEEVAQQVMQILKKVGKKPVLCNKDVPGFIANRMQHALWREAISIVENGIADAKTVDEAVKYSFGLRLPQLAPLENSDMVGLQLTYNIHDYVLKNLEDSHEPSPLLKKYLGEGKKGFISGEGFKKWAPEEIEKVKHDLNEYLIKMIYGI